MGRSRELAELASAYDGSSLGFRNRIINGDMRISQRGTSFTGLTEGSTQYTVDRWRWQESGTSTGVQTVTQDTSAPSGFVNSWKVQTTTAHSPLGVANSYRCLQAIEGTNISDLAWGTSSAQAVTLSFWVRSSLTGVFGGSVNNEGATRYYVFSYTVNAADTWEQKTITIAGDTTGTWGTNTGLGILLVFSLGTGSNYLTTPGSWGSDRFDAPTGQVNVAGTLNATWQITGVQLEAGSVATPFERRHYGTELALCQRYYQTINNYIGNGTNTTTFICNVGWPVTMRASPTIGLSGAAKITDGFTNDYTQSAAQISIQLGTRITPQAAQVLLSNFSALTTGRAYFSIPNEGGVVLASAEL